MKITRKFLSAILVVCILMSVFSSMAFASSNNNASILKTASVHRISDKNTHSIDRDELGKNKLDSYLQYDMVALDESDLQTINKNMLLQLLDNGVTLYIEGDSVLTDGSLKDFAFPEIPNIVAKGVDNLGIFIFNQNGFYCFGLVNQVIATEVPLNSNENMPQGTENNVIPIDALSASESTIQAQTNNASCIDLSELVSGVKGFRRDFTEKGIIPAKPDVVKMQLPDKSFNGTPFYNFTYVTYGVNRGSISITEYRYDICTIVQSGVTRKYADVVSQITMAAAPTSVDGGTYVGYYNTRMHSNISNMGVIGQSYLSSNTSSSYTMSGGITIGSGGTVTQGSVSASTTNSYNTNSQNIVNDFYIQKVKNWNCDPVVDTYGASWCIEPCIRVVNNNATAYQSGAFTSIQGGMLYNRYTGWSIPVFEVGGYW